MYLFYNSLSCKGLSLCWENPYHPASQKFTASHRPQVYQTRKTGCCCLWLLPNVRWDAVLGAVGRALILSSLVNSRFDAHLRCLAQCVLHDVYFSLPLQIPVITEIIILTSVPSLCWSISGQSLNNSLCSINMLSAFQEKDGLKSVTFHFQWKTNLLKACGAASYPNTETCCCCIYLVIKMQHVSHLPSTFFNVEAYLKAFWQPPKASNFSSCYLGCHANPALSQQGATAHTVLWVPWSSSRGKVW